MLYFTTSHRNSIQRNHGEELIGKRIRKKKKDNNKLYNRSNSRVKKGWPQLPATEGVILVNTNF